MGAAENILWGPEGEHLNKYTVQQNGIPRGTLMHYYDGRKFRFYNNGGTLQVIGTLNTGVLPVANHVNMSVATAAAVNDTSIAVTLGGGTTAAGLYDDGYINTDTAGSGGGYLYKLATGQAASVSTALTVTLAKGYFVKVALIATTSKASLMKNPFDSCIICATTPGTAPVGVSVSTAAATTGWGWMQTAGNCSVLTDGTVVAGNQVVPSTNTAGAVFAQPADVLPPVGVVQRLAATTNYSIVKLMGFE